MSKGARIRQQRVQAPQRSGAKRVKTPTPPGQPPSRRNLYLGVLGAVILLAIVLVGASVLSSRSSSSPKTASISSAAATAKLLAGIHQRGTTLGNPGAPVTMQEFADIQCPGCDQYMTTAFPDIVRKYIRTGKVKVEWNGIAFIGPDSEKGLRFVNAAGHQNRLWNVAELLYRNQGQENSGWVTNELLRSAGAAVPGLDVNRVEQEANGAAVNRQMAAAANLYSEYGFNQTPSFAIGPTGGTLQPFNPSSYSVGSFAPTFDKYIQQSKQ
jgi:protein-disulfide isomerase